MRYVYQEGFNGNRVRVGYCQTDYSQNETEIGVKVYALGFSRVRVIVRVLRLGQVGKQVGKQEKEEEECYTFW